MLSHECLNSGQIPLFYLTHGNLCWSKGTCHSSILKMLFIKIRRFRVPSRRGREVENGMIPLIISDGQRCKSLANSDSTLPPCIHPPNGGYLVKWNLTCMLGFFVLLVFSLKYQWQEWVIPVQGSREFGFVEDVRSKNCISHRYMYTGNMPLKT